LPPKQLASCAEYLVDLNATLASIRAESSARNAASQGERFLRNVEIHSEITRLLEERAKPTEIDYERVVREFAGLAFYDPGALGVARVKDRRISPTCQRRCGVGWSWDKAGNFTLKLSDKFRSLDLFA
jgi:phage terminase small subunit